MKIKDGDQLGQTVNPHPLKTIIRGVIRLRKEAGPNGVPV